MRTRNTTNEEVYEKALMAVLRKLEGYTTAQSSHAFRAELKGYIKGILGVIEAEEVK